MHHLNAYMVQYQKDRCARDPAYHMLRRLRCRLRAATKANKCASTLELTGCTSQQLRGHLESQFHDGMTWDNRHKWHIDHIRPCAAFDLTDESEQRACFHYSNLQPLWARDNLSKGSRH